MATDGAPPIRSRLIPPVWLLLATGLSWALHHLAPGVTLLVRPWTFLGAIPIALGVTLAVWADTQFFLLGTPALPTKRPLALATTGVYRRTRNPMYLGMVIALMGEALYLGSLTPWVVPFLFAAWIQYAFIRPEEAALTALFGENYRTYCAQVRRWL